MAANVRTEMRIPTRTAPRPPINSHAQRSSAWSSTGDIFNATLTTQLTQKKKPPPRPPPPKFHQQSYAQSQKDQKPKKPTRPTELLTNLFARKAAGKQEHLSTSCSYSNLSNGFSRYNSTGTAVSLIDLSPPGSPTFTTRSSSDGVSVDSFGSDGNSNPSAFTSSGNTSQTESAFEDDFDFFGLSNKKLSSNDPWQIKPVQDPFGPIEENFPSTSQDVKQIGEASFFAFNSDADKQVPFKPINSTSAHAGPTIIRPKPPKPPAPKIAQKKLQQISDQTQNQINGRTTVTPFGEPVTMSLSYSWNDDFKEDRLEDSPSPPMPTIPPPAPPSEYLIESDNSIEINCKTPYGIALYNFPMTHPEDLSLKEGDIVTLVRIVNDDWMEGRVGDRQGIFPINFVDIKVPLPGLQDNTVIALYPFIGETSDDLSFEEGAKIKVLSKVSEDWLYGECEGRKGQFPSNYVNRIPCSISDSL